MWVRRKKGEDQELGVAFHVSGEEGTKSMGRRGEEKGTLVCVAPAGGRMRLVS